MKDLKWVSLNWRVLDKGLGLKIENFGFFEGVEENGERNCRVIIGFSIDFICNNCTEFLDFNMC